MHVQVVAYPPYRAGLGAGVLELDVAEDSRLRDVLTLLARRSQEFEPLAAARNDEWLWGQLLVHVKGEMVRLDERLHEGDRLELLPPIAGGAINESRRGGAIRLARTNESRVGGACGPPPPFAAPLVPRCALSSGATPRDVLRAPNAVKPSSSQ
jgi:molybdopterin converting factor small subunit